jgi:hypothetical protein
VRLGTIEFLLAWNRHRNELGIPWPVLDGSPRDIAQVGMFVKAPTIRRILNHRYSSKNILKLLLTQFLRSNQFYEMEI